MSQFDFGTIDPLAKSGTALAADLTSWRTALHSGHRGGTAPAYAVAGMEWVDDALDPLWVVKRYDGTNWVIVEAIDTTLNVGWSVNVGERLRYPVAGGTANALTLTPAVATTAYLDTDVVTLEAAANNSAAATLNVSGVGAKAIRKIVSGADVAIVAGDILAAGRYKFNYKAAAAAGAGAWILTNPSTSSGLGFGSSNAASVTDLSKHIALFSTTHGFSVTANRINYVAPTGVDHVFVVNGTDVARVGGNGLIVGAPSGGAPGAGKVNVVEIQQNSLPIRPRVTSAAVATTSGTSFDFTGIASWATKIVVHFNGVSLSGTDNILVQIGAGSVDTTGYVSSGALLIDVTNPSIVTSTAGMIVAVASATASISGDMIINLEDTANNIWVGSHIFGANASRVATGGGTKTLSGALDRVRVTRNGSNTFDAGSISISWE